MNKEYDKYLSQANFDIQNQEEHNNLKEYVACILYDNDRKDKEIERLNNIINELEKWLEELANLEPKYEYEIAYCNAYECCLDKLKELKEGK